MWGQPATATGTHILVVGISSYPWCAGGPLGPTPEACSTIQQLTSPHRSAHAVARWMSEHAEMFSPPLRSIRLVADPIAGQTFTPSPPDFSTIKREFRAWQAAGDAGSTMLLYWCGHGFQHENQQLLLTRNAGEDGELEEHAVDITKTFALARASAPKTQLWLIDACREAASALDLHCPSGRSLLPSATTSQLSQVTLKDMSMVVASALYQSASGQTNDPSWFSRALLDALSWRAYRKVNGQWMVRTTDLVAPINASLRELLAEHTDTGQTCSASDGIGQHPVLLSPSAPTVPTQVLTAPSEVQERVRLDLRTLAGDPLKSQDEPSDRPWQVDVAAGLMWLRGTHADTDAAHEEVVSIDPDNREAILSWQG